MLIALDYDSTYTLDPDLWNKIIDLILLAGHEIICCTMRFESEGHEVMNTIGKKCKVIFTGRKAKYHFVKHLDITPDVWIDDNPFWIYNNAN